MSISGSNLKSRIMRALEENVEKKQKIVRIKGSGSEPKSAELTYNSLKSQGYITEEKLEEIEGNNTTLKAEIQRIRDEPRVKKIKQPDESITTGTYYANSDSDSDTQR